MDVVRAHWHQVPGPRGTDGVLLPGRPPPAHAGGDGDGVVVAAGEQWVRGIDRGGSPGASLGWLPGDPKPVPAPAHLELRSQSCCTAQRVPPNAHSCCHLSIALNEVSLAARGCAARAAADTGKCGTPPVGVSRTPAWQRPQADGGAPGPHCNCWCHWQLPQVPRLAPFRVRVFRSKLAAFAAAFALRTMVVGASQSSAAVEQQVRAQQLQAQSEEARELASSLAARGFTDAARARAQLADAVATHRAAVLKSLATAEASSRRTARARNAARVWWLPLACCWPRTS